MSSETQPGEKLYNRMILGWKTLFALAVIIGLGYLIVVNFTSVIMVFGLIVVSLIVLVGIPVSVGFGVEKLIWWIDLEGKR